MLHNIVKKTAINGSTRQTSAEMLSLCMKLQKIAINLLSSKDHNASKYNTLSIQNETLQNEILQYHGSLAFLSALGYKYDSLQSLICENINHHQIESCLEALHFQTMVLAPSTLLNVVSKEEFDAVAADIFFYNQNSYLILDTLRSVTRKLFRHDPRYRTLDTTNPRVQERLLGYEHAIDFLELLGFKPDALGMKLKCHHDMPDPVLQNAMQVLNKYREYANPDKDTHDNNEDTWTFDMILINITCSGSNQSRDGFFIDALLLTHKMYTDSLTLMRQLRKRFMVELPKYHDRSQAAIDDFYKNIAKPIHLRCVKILRDWIKNYWSQDFDGNKELQKELNVWLNDMKSYNEINEYDKDNKYMKLLHTTVEKEMRRMMSSTMDTDEKSNDDPKDMVSNKDKELIDNCTAEEIADQLTLMDVALFSKITKRDWLSFCTKYKKPMESNVTAMLDRFDDLIKYVQYGIVKETSLKNRVKFIKKWINAGERLREINNYHSLNAIYSALSDKCIQRLTKEWNRIPQKYLAKFEDWKKDIDANKTKL